MPAKLRFTSGAFQTGICCIRKLFRVPAVGDFPAQQKNERTAEQAVIIHTRHEDEGGEHHCKIPVVNAAGRTAAVFHKPCLKGAEKQDADDVTDRIGKTDENQDALVNDAEEIQHTEQRIECNPDTCDQRSGFP